MSAAPQGALLVVGGREEKDPARGCPILAHAAARCRGGGTFLLITAATNYPEAIAEMYWAVLPALGVANTVVVDIREPAEAHRPDLVELAARAAVIYLPGGSQARLVEMLAATPMLEAMLASYRGGAMLGGTSAGATAMSSLMIAEGYSAQSYRHDSLELAAGFGLLPGTIIDTHFAQRGRLGRLLGAVAAAPDHLGIGLDENTAMLVTAGHRVAVVGGGAMTLVDGRHMVIHAPADPARSTVMGFENVRLDVLADGDSFDLAARQRVADQRWPD